VVRRAALLAAAGVAAGAPATGLADTWTESAAAGGVTAELAYVAEPPLSEYVRTSGLSLTIARHDGTVRTLVAEDLALEYEDNVIVPGEALAVRDLDGDAEPEVVLDSYWGGAHCCFQSRIAWWSPPDGTYRLRVVTWGDVPARLRDLDGDGRPEFVATDHRFAYALGASAADSVFPVRVWSFSRGRMTVVTRRHPALVRRDLSRHWRLYLRYRREGRAVANVLGAYLAGAYVLDRERVAWARVRSAEGRRNPRMLRGIRSALIRWGYAPR